MTAPAAVTLPVELLTEYTLDAVTRPGKLKLIHACGWVGPLDGEIGVDLVVRAMAGHYKDGCVTSSTRPLNEPAMFGPRRSR